MKKRKLNRQKDSEEVFIEALNELSSFANEHCVQLMIENNVLTQKNMETFSDNPFLMAEDSSCIHIIKNAPRNIKLLIDVSHLLITSKTLKLNPVKGLQNCYPWTGGYHLSNTNGIVDDNKKITTESWFWPYLKKNLSFYSIETADSRRDKILAQVKIAEKFLL
jgi:sugar phosphate isomerase/epimerase